LNGNLKIIINEELKKTRETRYGLFQGISHSLGKERLKITTENFKQDTELRVEVRSGNLLNSKQSKFQLIMKIGT
jgi:hypothetical protein